MEEHPQARFIVDTLNAAGFIAYYAGGWVRDYLLQHPSDDIDIATNAPPETIQALFPHTVPIGIAFGIILVIIDGHQYEVATFRQDLDYKDGRRPSRVEFTTAVEDAKRRDFTINGMFYDPLKKEVLDYVGGRADLAKGVIRAIGNPHERIREDRLRMIRACRLSCRFGFPIEPDTAKAIRAHAGELFPAVAVERVYQEFTKGHDFKKLGPMLLLLHEFGLLSAIFPTLSGVSVAEVAMRLAPIEDYPPDAPVIACLLPLFPESALAEQLALCKQFKLSKTDQEFVLFLSRKMNEKVEWAYFYANRFAEWAIQIMGAPLEPQQRTAFLKHHLERRAALQWAVERIQKHDPVVKSGDLIAAGVSPGPAMGLLLREAERIAINEELHSTETVIQRLKKTPLWPSQ